MQDGSSSAGLRRSSRVPTALPILVTSLEGTHFSEVCETLVVNAHGCAMLSPAKLDTGVALRFHSKDGRETTARVVSCQPVGPDHRRWRLGARLDQPDNFWGLSDCPEDWALPVTPTRLSHVFPPTTTLAPYKMQLPPQPSPEAMMDTLARRLEGPVKRLISETVLPLQTEIAELKERLAHREANPGRFELSLNSIPPELEQRVKLRLRDDLGPQVLQEAREQYANLLAAAKTTIDQRTNEGYDEFVRRVSQELGTVESRAEAVAGQISENAHLTLQRGIEDVRQHVLDGGNALKRLSNELFEYLQQNLNDEHNARREDLEKLRTAIGAESSRLIEQIEYIEGRIAKLDQSARELESGLDKRLSQMASNTVKDARAQLEAAAGEIHDELMARAGKSVGDQLEQASQTMRSVQTGIVASASDALKAHAEENLLTFRRSTEDQAERSVERWRRKLADSLNAASKNLGERLPSQSVEREGD